MPSISFLWRLLTVSIFLIRHSKNLKCIVRTLIALIYELCWNSTCTEISLHYNHHDMNVLWSVHVFILFVWIYLIHICIGGIYNLLYHIESIGFNVYLYTFIKYVWIVFTALSIDTGTRAVERLFWKNYRNFVVVFLIRD